MRSSYPAWRCTCLPANAYVRVEKLLFLFATLNSTSSRPDVHPISRPAPHTTAASAFVSSPPLLSCGLSAVPTPAAGLLAVDVHDRCSWEMITSASSTRRAARRASPRARAPARGAIDTARARGHRTRHVRTRHVSAPRPACRGARRERPPVSRNAAPTDAAAFSRACRLSIRSEARVFFCFATAAITANRREPTTF